VPDPQGKLEATVSKDKDKDIEKAIKEEAEKIPVKPALGKINQGIKANLDKTGKGDRKAGDK